MFVIKASKKEEFIREINQNEISDSFLEECRKAASVFNRKAKNIKEDNEN